MASEELVGYHVCIQTGNKVGSERPENFDLWHEKGEMALWWNVFSSFSLLSWSVSLVSEQLDIMWNEKSLPEELWTFLASHTKEVCTHREWTSYISKVCIHIVHSCVLPAGHASESSIMHYLWACVSEQACAMVCVMSCVKTSTLPEESRRKHQVSQNCRPLLGTETADSPHVLSRLFLRRDFHLPLTSYIPLKPGTKSGGDGTEMKMNHYLSFWAGITACMSPVAFMLISGDELIESEL